MTSQLVAALKQIVGAPHVLTNPRALRAYAQDGYTLARGTPVAVVLPGSATEVGQVVALLSQAGVAVVARGAGTSLSGGAIPADGAVILHFSRMRQIHHIDWENGIIEVDPGVVNRDVTRAVAGRGYFYAPDPSSQQACTIGGNFAENSGGPHCLKYGVTINHVLMADVVLADGNTVRLGNLAGALDGPDWLGLFIGSEGTLGIATRLWLRLTPAPAKSRTVLALYDNVEEASLAVSSVIAHGVIPAAMEMMDRLAMDAVERGAYPVGYPRDAEAVLLIEIDGTVSRVDSDTEEILAQLRHSGVRHVVEAQNDAERDWWWANRKTAFGAMGLISPHYYVQDGVIPRHRLPEALDTIGDIARFYNIRIANVFHAGDGNLHPLLLYDDQDADQVLRVRQAGHDILAYCVKVGGSITGEHGVGLEKLDELPLQFPPPALALQSAIKRVFDPRGGLNPGKALPTPGRCIDYD